MGKRTPAGRAAWGFTGNAGFILRLAVVLSPAAGASLPFSVPFPARCGVQCAGALGATFRGDPGEIRFASRVGLPIAMGGTY